MSHVPPSPIGRILPRRAAAVVEQALADTRVVLVNGARQCGKSTLAAEIADARGGQWRSLDRAATRQAASFDPTEFVANDDLMVIDEIQRVPELLLAIKESVDNDPRPGRFLLTGSARVLSMRAVPDALPGRMETVELWPLSQGEIDDKPDRFVDAAFALGPELRHDSAETRSGYIDRVVRGGFPVALARAGARRERFLDSYVADIVNRDVIQLSEIERGPQMRALIRLVAARSGQLLVPGALGSELGLPQPTVKRYLALLEEVFLIKRIPAWSRNLSSRAVGTAKVAMVDSGIAANLLGLDAGSLRRPETSLGPLLEGFAAMEIARQLTWSEQRAEAYHYHTKDNVEVDLILENRRGQVVAVEVKAGSTVRAEDFRGLRHLAARLGDDLLVGIVLYTGRQTLPFGPRFRAIPLSVLWEASPPQSLLRNPYYVTQPRVSGLDRAGCKLCGRGGERCCRGPADGVNHRVTGRPDHHGLGHRQARQAKRPAGPPTPAAPALPGSDGDLTRCHDADITTDTIIPTGLADKLDLELAIWACLANARLAAQRAAEDQQGHDLAA